MKKLINVLIVLLLCTLDQTIAQEIPNPTENPVIGFINDEKIRIRATEIVDRYLHPEKYKNQGNTETDLPSLQTIDNETTVSNKSVPESEIHAAINPTNANNLVVSPIKQDMSDPTNAVTCPIYYSFDGGMNWAQSNFVTKPYSQQVSLLGGGDQVLVFDADGTLYLSWINLYITYVNQSPDSLRAALYWAKSTDGGKTFQFDELNKFGGKVFSFKYTNNPQLTQMLDKQWMAADKSKSQWRNSVYTSAVYINQSGFTSSLQLHIYRKRANEENFNLQPTIINTTGTTIVQFGSIDVDDTGKVHYTFYGSNGSAQTLYHCVSKDGGVTFSTPVKISNILGSMRGMSLNEAVPGISSSRLYPSPYMAVDKSNSPNKGNIYITWSGNGISSKLQNGMDVYFSKSTNGGSNWSTPVAINNDALPGVHSFYSNIAVNDSGVIAITFYDRRNHVGTIASQGISDFFIALSFDGGETFTNNKVSSAPSRFDRIGFSNNGFGIGEYNAIVMSKDYAYPVWADGRTNNGNINIYIARVKLDRGLFSGIEEIKSISDILLINDLSPNPANEFIQFELNSKMVGNAIIEIIDLNGRVLGDELRVLATNDNQRISLNTSHLPSGNYFVKVSVNNIYTIKKFVIAN